MDQWTEASWPHRADAPVLRAVSGRSVRVLRRGAGADIGYEPDELIGNKFGETEFNVLVAHESFIRVLRISQILAAIVLEM